MKTRDIYLALISLLFVSCSKTDISPGGSGVVDEGNSTEFNSLLVTVSLKLNDSLYVVNPSLDSIAIYVDNNFWSFSNSTTIDTSLVDYFLFNNVLVTKDKLTYLVLANRSIEPLSTATAGEYSSYLNGLYDINAGQHVCHLNTKIAMG